MKSVIVLFFTVLTIGSASAQETLLNDLYENYGKIYSSMGKGNNGLLKQEFQTSSISELNKELGNKKMLKLATLADQMKYLNKCLFITEGSNGEHINKRQQNDLSTAFLRSLNDWYINTPEMYAVFNVELQTNNKCAILLSSSLNDEGILLQGANWN